jgi:hypothetical protein
MPDCDHPWQLTVRVFGGRLDHQAAPHATRAGRRAAALRIACTGRHYSGTELDNALCGRPCTRCAHRIWAYTHPDAVQRQQAARRGQDALPLQLLD